MHVLIIEGGPLIALSIQSALRAPPAFISAKTKPMR
jgi:hypothetical protein